MSRNFNAVSGHKKSAAADGGVIGGSAFPLEEGNHQLCWWKLRLKL